MNYAPSMQGGGAFLWGMGASFQVGNEAHPIAGPVAYQSATSPATEPSSSTTRCGSVSVLEKYVARMS